MRKFSPSYFSEYSSKQCSVWLAYPSFPEFKKGYPIKEFVFQLIEALLTIPSIRVSILIENSQEKVEIQKRISSIDRIHFFEVPHFDIWIRDFGPQFIFLEYKKNENEIVKKKAITYFKFNDWGCDLEMTTESVKINEKVCERVCDHLDEVSFEKNEEEEIVHEGGNHSINSQGDMLLCYAVESQRNQTNTYLQRMMKEKGISLRESLESMFKKKFGVKRIIWLEQGLMEDDLTFNGRVFDENGKKEAYTLMTTGGHVDECCRFVSNDTILLSDVDDEEAKENKIAKENQKRMNEAERYFKSLGFKVVRMPSPPITYTTMCPGDYSYDVISEMKYEDGHSFPKKGETVKVCVPCSYMNYVIVNETILFPQYYQESKDEKLKELDTKAKETIQSIFPLKKLIFLNPYSINLGGGGIHCMTKNEPLLLNQ